ncbi:MAG: hypothetical protein KDA96_09295 [Planctomycetaceae bacterium]|nr:hypothetical protein [Planctomycetaceae bacterium]
MKVAVRFFAILFVSALSVGTAFGQGESKQQPPNPPTSVEMHCATVYLYCENLGTQTGSLDFQSTADCGTAAFDQQAKAELEAEYPGFNCDDEGGTVMPILVYEVECHVCETVRMNVAEPSAPPSQPAPQTLPTARGPWKIRSIVRFSNGKKVGFVGRGCSQSAAIQQAWLAARAYACRTSIGICCQTVQLLEYPCNNCCR